MVSSAELVVLDDSELEGRLEETRRELFNLRFQLATGQLDNSSRLREVRRDVARILTILRQREIALAEALEQGSNTPSGTAPSKVHDTEPVGAGEEEDS